MKRLLFSIVLMWFISSSCFSRGIKLYGKWSHNKKSIETSLPIEAFIDESTKELSLQFGRDLGLVSVTVLSDSGEIIYYEVLDAIEFSSYTIQLDKKLQGEYVISISDDMNNNIYGLFKF